MSQPTILCVDDEERVLRSLRAVLRSGDYEIRTTTDPQEAIQIAEGDSVDVVISDQRMPGMQGVDVLREIREREPNAVRILLTGYSDNEAAIRAVNEGEIFRYLQKPWDPNELRSLIDEAVKISAQLRTSPQVSESETQQESSGEVLVLDEDDNTTDLVKRSVPQGVSVRTTEGIEEAFDILTSDSVDVLVTDAVVHGEDVSGVLSRLKQVAPHIQTIIVAERNDTNHLISLINQGRVARFLPKPVSQTLLQRGLQTSLTRAAQLRAMPELAVTEKTADGDEVAEGSLMQRVSGYMRRLAGA